MFQYYELRNLRSQTSLHLSIITKTSETLIPTKVDEVKSVDSNSGGFLVSDGLVSELRAVNLHRTATCLLKFVVIKAKIYLGLTSLCALINQYNAHFLCLDLLSVRTYYYYFLYLRTYVF